MEERTFLILMGSVATGIGLVFALLVLYGDKITTFMDSVANIPPANMNPDEIHNPWYPG